MSEPEFPNRQNEMGWNERALPDCIFLSERNFISELSSATQYDVWYTGALNV